MLDAHIVVPARPAVFLPQHALVGVGDAIAAAHGVVVLCAVPWAALLGFHL